MTRINIEVGTFVLDLTVEEARELKSQLDFLLDPEYPAFIPDPDIPDIPEQQGE